MNRICIYQLSLTSLKGDFKHSPSGSPNVNLFQPVTHIIELRATAVRSSDIALRLDSRHVGDGSCGTPCALRLGLVLTMTTFYVVH